jgi:hypothetical protein
VWNQATNGGWIAGADGSQVEIGVQLQGNPSQASNCVPFCGIRGARVFASQRVRL